MKYYLVYKMTGIPSSTLLLSRKEVLDYYGHKNWFIFDRDCKIDFTGDKLAIREWCINKIASLDKDSIMVVDVRDGVGRLGWEEIRAAEETGLKVETFGGPLPSERRYLTSSFKEVLSGFNKTSPEREVSVSIERYRSLLG